MRITVLVNNEAVPGFAADHGLALWLEYEGQRILFDTGAGETLAGNADRAGIDLNSAELLILSHGHYDHTGGVPSLSPDIPVVCGRGYDAPCWSFHADGSRHAIGLPAASAAVLTAERVRIITGFTEILPGLWLTGPIARTSGEDTGGDFRSDEAGTQAQTVPEELALLTADGTLITGCCHAGIINTVSCCRQAHPEIPLRRIVGGLHLLHADGARLASTIACLRELTLESVIPLHCSGVDVPRLFREAGLPVRMIRAGEIC